MVVHRRSGRGLQGIRKIGSQRNVCEASPIAVRQRSVVRCLMHFALLGRLVDASVLQPLAEAPHYRWHAIRAHDSTNVVLLKQPDWCEGDRLAKGPALLVRGVPAARSWRCGAFDRRGSLRDCPVPLTVRGTQALVSFAPLAFKLFYAARQNAVLRRSPFPPP